MAGPRASRTFQTCITTAGLLAALLSRSALVHAEEPLAPEVDTNPSVAPPPSARPNLVLVGAAVAVGWYGAAYGTSYLWPSSNGASSLRIPVAGPYMALAKTGCSSGASECSTTLGVVLRTILTSLSAVGQTGGILAMLDGAFVPTSSSPPSARRPSEARWAREPAVHVAIAPTTAGAPEASRANGLNFEVFGEF
jgi:hypothetical protein